MNTTLEELRQMVRWRTDNPGDNISDEELNAYINYALGEMDDALNKTHGNHKVETEDLTISDGYSSLPSDCLSILAVSDINGSNEYPLTQFSLQQPIYQGNYCREPQWQRRGQRLYMRNFSGTQVRVYYVPKFEKLTSDSDELPDYMNFQDWIEMVVCDVAAKINHKYDLDPSMWLQMKQMQVQRIKEANTPRDQGPALSMSKNGRSRFSRGRGIIR